MPITQILMTAGSGGGGGGYNGSGPLPGEGSYQSSWSVIGGYIAQGTPFDPGGGVASVNNASVGWFRTIFSGIWSNGGSNDNPGIFNGSPNFSTADSYGGFGQTGTGDNYCMEWRGYIQIFNTDTYNFLTDSDDVAMFWIGTAALDPDNNAPLCTSNNGFQLNANSVNLTAGLFYPIRMRFQEWSGDERCQVYAGIVSNSLTAMNNWNLRYNANTNGY